MAVTKGLPQVAAPEIVSCWCYSGSGLSRDGAEGGGGASFTVTSPFHIVDGRAVLEKCAVFQTIQRKQTICMSDFSLFLSGAMVVLLSFLLVL